MRAKFFKRSLSFLIDANLVFGLIYLTFILFGRTLVQSSVPNYVEHERLYIIELEKSNELIKEIDQQAVDGTITKEEHEILFEQYMTQHNENVEDVVGTVIAYNLIYVPLYFLLNFAIINYIYNLILKGNTFGRRFTKLRLDGNIKWYSLFTREFIYKGFFGLLTLPIDAYLITFSKSRKAIRDRVSGIYVVDESVRYPF